MKAKVIGQWLGRLLRWWRWQRWQRRCWQWECSEAKRERSAVAVSLLGGHLRSGAPLVLRGKVKASVYEVVGWLLRGIECPHDDQSGHLNEQQGIEHPLRHEAAATAASGTLVTAGDRWQG